MRRKNTRKALSRSKEVVRLGLQAGRGQGGKNGKQACVLPLLIDKEGSEVLCTSLSNKHRWDPDLLLDFLCRENIRI